jgi:hypothetical protein
MQVLILRIIPVEEAYICLIPIGDYRSAGVEISGFLQNNKQDQFASFRKPQLTDATPSPEGYPRREVKAKALQGE